MLPSRRTGIDPSPASLSRLDFAYGCCNYKASVCFVCALKQRGTVYSTITSMSGWIVGRQKSDGG